MWLTPLEAELSEPYQEEEKMKKLTLALNVVGELLSFLLLASLTTSSFSKRVELTHRNGYVESMHSMEETLKREDERIAFMKAKLKIGGTSAEYEQIQSSTKAPLYSGQTIGTVNYVVEVGLGTPAQDLLMVIDTALDLTWTQCLPCDICYEQHDPIFDPTTSSSYQQVLCSSEQCAQIGPQLSSTCNFSTNGTNCDYSIFYLDGSITMGDFALEKLTVGGDPGSMTYPFGCGHTNQGFNGMDGSLGLSRDALSFPTQTKEAFGEIFAYCMPNLFSSTAGYMEFGVTSAGSTSTPLVFVNETTVYVVELEDIQVEGTSNKSKLSDTMVMVVDSEVVITRLDIDLYEQVRDAFREASASFKPAPKGVSLGIFDTCYSVPNGTIFPSITLTFMGGLAFTLSAQTSVFPIDNNGTFCLAFLPLDGLSILGTYQQQGSLFTFDIPHSSLSISSDSC